MRRLVRERADMCLVGNHDLVTLGTIGIEDLNPRPPGPHADNDALDEESRSYLAAHQSAAPERLSLQTKRP